jgi:hypothetical protein
MSATALKEGTTKGQDAFIRATERAVKTGKPVDAKSIFVIPITTLDGYDNPRHEPANCYEKGFILFGDPNVDKPEFDKQGRCVKFVSLVHLLTSDNLQKLEYGIKVIMENESVDREKTARCRPVHPGTG